MTTRPAPERIAELAAATVVVVVTHRREESLARSLAAIAGQSPAPGHVVVVDNAASEAARAVVEAAPLPSTYLPSHRNLGGAGGFALGILTALAHGAEFVWLADDDGRPASASTLGTLLGELTVRELGQVSPVVVREGDPRHLAFPTRRALRRRDTVDDLGTDFVPGFAALFNGALFRADTLDVVGVPDYRLFLRGDEIEMHRRLERAGIAFGTVTSAAYEHPSGAEEFTGALNVEVPGDGAKSYYTFRNRGYLTNQPGKRLKAPLEWAVYTALFLGVRRDRAAWQEWLRLMRQGRSEKFTRYEDR